MIDVFAKLDDARVELHPFPYLVIENVMPDDVCEALICEMPPLDVLTHGQPLGDNKRFNFTYANAVAARGISPLWRDVLTQAVSQRFLDRLLRLFSPSILEFYPDFETRFAPIDRLKAEVRSKKNAREPGSIMLDAQIAVNTPAITGGTSVRTPHLDRTDKIFVGLLYLRLPGDNSEGADLELLSPNDNGPLIYGDKRMLPAESTTHVRTIPYRRNTLVIFLNTAQSLHGVTPRGVTPHTRYFINLVAETSEPLFHVDTVPATPEEVVAASIHRPGLLGRIWHGLGGTDRIARSES
jgi:hypothetical protein